jgi:predicted dehydrogenase
MKHMKNVKLVGVCDIIPERAKEYAEEFGVEN